MTLTPRSTSLPPKKAAHARQGVREISPLSQLVNHDAKTANSAPLGSWGQIGRGESERMSMDLSELGTNKDNRTERVGRDYRPGIARKYERRGRGTDANGIKKSSVPRK